MSRTRLNTLNMKNKVKEEIKYEWNTKKHSRIKKERTKYNWVTKNMNQTKKELIDIDKFKSNKHVTTSD